MPVSYAIIEGYIPAKVIVEAVRRLKGKSTRDGMIVALNSIDNYDLGAYVVGFEPGALAGSKFVELSIIARAAARFANRQTLAISLSGLDQRPFFAKFHLENQ